jgi:hypothetical protein
MGDFWFGYIVGGTMVALAFAILISTSEKRQ